MIDNQICEGIGFFLGLIIVLINLPIYVWCEYKDWHDKDHKYLRTLFFWIINILSWIVIFIVGHYSSQCFVSIFGMAFISQFLWFSLIGIFICLCFSN